MYLPNVKDLVVPGSIASFVKCFDNNLWYEIWLPGKDEAEAFQFPVPIADIGNATFWANDKAILFMRYIRKHIELLKTAQTEAP